MVPFGEVAVLLSKAIAFADNDGGGRTLDVLVIRAVPATNMHGVERGYDMNI